MKKGTRIKLKGDAADVYGGCPHPVVGFHAPSSVGSYATLCGIGEEGYEEERSFGAITCNDCIEVIKVASEYV